MRRRLRLCRRDTLVGSSESDLVWRSGSRSTALTGTPLMAQMEELSRQSGKILLEMERFKYRAGEEESGAAALVLDLAKAFERVSLPVVWAWATHFSFTRKILRVLCGYFEHQRRVQFEGCAAEPLTTTTANPARGRSGAPCSYGMCCRRG